MVIQSSNMKMSSSRAYSQSVELSHSTSIFQSNSTNLFSAGGSLTSSRERDSSKSGGFLSTFQESFQNAKTKEDAAIPSQTYTPESVKQVHNPLGRDSNRRLEMLQYLLEYMERIREAMLARLTGGHSTNWNNVAGSDLNLSSETGNGVTVWERVESISFTHTEIEMTSFEATGNVMTEDGRSIDFNVQLNLSRSFCETTSFEQHSIQNIMTDPLVLQLNDVPTDLSDTTFLFDLDCDGITEAISMLSDGSAFLALDRNGDNVINDGSELFGTQSGNGFADLAQYDEDGNGWIDENDSIFKDLRLWSKTTGGMDQLIGLKEGNVGAIYLGYSRTRFALNSIEDNHTKGMIQASGVYLKESGEAGVIQHIDMASA